MKAVIKQPALNGLGTIPKGIEVIGPKRKKEVVVIAQREFVGGCVAFWLAACCSEYSVTVATETLPGSARANCASPAAVLIDASGPERELCWIEEQVAAQRDQGISAPFVLLVDPKDAGHAVALVTRLHLGGYIPTSDTTDVAAAALRLIIAGGIYLPYNRVEMNESSITSNRQIDVNSIVTCYPLTLREQAVLELLEAGMPNKTIARQLGMSLSTVKIHVHHIIRKFNVQNRTGAVIVAGKHKLLSPEISARRSSSEYLCDNLLKA